MTTMMIMINNLLTLTVPNYGKLKRWPMPSATATLFLIHYSLTL